MEGDALPVVVVAALLFQAISVSVGRGGVATSASTRKRTKLPPAGIIAPFFLAFLLS